jgi:hypothetical protein
VSGTKCHLCLRTLKGLWTISFCFLAGLTRCRTREQAADRRSLKKNGATPAESQSPLSTLTYAGFWQLRSEPGPNSYRLTAVHPRRSPVRFGSAEHRRQILRCQVDVRQRTSPTKVGIGKRVPGAGSINAEEVLCGWDGVTTNLANSGRALGSALHGMRIASCDFIFAPARSSAVQDRSMSADDAVDLLRLASSTQQAAARRIETDQLLNGFSSPRTVGISSETVGWIGTAHCRIG